MQPLETYVKELVGASRFERPTSCSQGRCANQAALRPDLRVKDLPDPDTFYPVLCCQDPAETFLFIRTVSPARSLTRGRAKSRSLFVATAPQGRRANQAALRPDHQTSY